jgi:hypothetical protein
VNFRCAVLAIAVIAATAAPIAAQVGHSSPWRLSYFPYLTASPNDGAMLMARVIRFQQAAPDDRITLKRYQAIEAGYSTRKAWLARATWAEPRIADGWRVMGHGEIGSEPHFGHPDSDLQRDRALFWVDVTREITDQIHVAIRGGVRHEEFGIAGLSESPSETDGSLRGAVIVDLRDREFETNRGVLVEAGMIVGTGGPDGYTAGYTHLRGWIDPLPRFRLTGRFAWRQAVSGASLAPRHEFPGWEGDFTMLGGQRSHRGLGVGELANDGAMFAGAEARMDVFKFKEIAAVTLIAFIDGGKPLRGDYLNAGGSPLPALDWIWSPGGGVAVRVLRAATLTLTAARHEGDTRLYVMSGYAW